MHIFVQASLGVGSGEGDGMGDGIGEAELVTGARLISPRTSVQEILGLDDEPS